MGLSKAISILVALASFLATTSNAADNHATTKPPFTSPPRPIRLIVTDVDGTLTEPKTRKFVEKNNEGFRLAHKLGIRVVFATGRPMEPALDVIGKANLEQMGYFGTPGIYVAGCYVVGEDGMVLRDSPFKPAVVEKVARLAESHGLLANLKVSKNSHYIPYNSIEELPDRFEQVYMLRIEGDRSKLSPLKQELDETCDVASVWTNSGSIELTPHEHNKGSGVLLLASSLGILPEDVLVLGDADNDVPMFKMMGTAVAVGSAKSVAKEAADSVTVPSAEGALLAVVKELERSGLYPAALSGDADRV